jgi:hypothetical protein
MPKTSEKKLASLENFLKEEIEKSEAILADPFLRANLYEMELGIHADKIGYYKQVLEKMESL